MRKRGLLNRPDRLSKIAYGALLSRYTLGIISTLDFACTVEYFKRGGAADGDGISLRRSKPRSCDLLQFIDYREAKQISGQDARFTDILAAMPGTLGDYLALASAGGVSRDGGNFLTTAVVNAVRQRIATIRSLPLDTCLTELLAQTARLDGRKLTALCARLGFGGLPPVTLEAAGRRICLTRERIRQLEQELRTRLPKHELFIPRLDDAIDVLNRVVPVRVTDAARLMAKKGISSRPFWPQSIMSAARLCGRPADFAIEFHHDSQWLTRGGLVHDVRTVTSLARKQAEASGVSNLEALSQELKTRTKIEFTAQQLRELLTFDGGFEFLKGNWFWYKKGKPHRNRLRNIARKMLSTASALDAAVIREGLRRVYRHRRSRNVRTWPLRVPPDAVLKRLFEVHPEFVVNQDGRIGPAMKLDYRTVLAPTERILVDVLRGTPTCLVDRATFCHRSIDLGMKRDTFGQYLTFSPVISRVGPGLWSLPGVRAASMRTSPRRIRQGTPARVPRWGPRQGATSPAKSAVRGSVHSRMLLGPQPRSEHV